MGSHDRQSDSQSEADKEGKGREKQDAHTYQQTDQTDDASGKFESHPDNQKWKNEREDQEKQKLLDLGERVVPHIGLVPVPKEGLPGPFQKMKGIQESEQDYDKDDTDTDQAQAQQQRGSH